MERRQARRSPRAVTLPAGYSLEWSGQYENMLRVRERLKLVVPFTLFLIFFLLYMNTRRRVKAAIVMLRGALLGGRRRLADVRRSATTSRSRPGSGMIALMGLDAETGVFMLLFLDLAYDEAKREGPAAARWPTCTRRSSTAR